MAGAAALACNSLDSVVELVSLNDSFLAPHTVEVEKLEILCIEIYAGGINSLYVECTLGGVLYSDVLGHYTAVVENGVEESNESTGVCIDRVNLECLSFVLGCVRCGHFWNSGLALIGSVSNILELCGCTAVRILYLKRGYSVITGTVYGIFHTVNVGGEVRCCFYGRLRTNAAVTFILCVFGKHLCVGNVRTVIVVNKKVAFIYGENVGRILCVKLEYLGI